MGPKGPRRKILFSGILFLLVMMVVESVAYVGVRVLAAKSLIYVPQMADGYAAYLETRHPVLGWPSVDPAADDERDASGSRLTPAFPDLARSPNCVVLYGDSFTWSSEVEAKDAWGNVLSRLLDCRVSNFGVGEYGTDHRPTCGSARTPATCRPSSSSPISLRISSATSTGTGRCSIR